jgi:hypothetical protein
VRRFAAISPKLVEVTAFKALTLMDERVFADFGFKPLFVQRLYCTCESRMRERKGNQHDTNELLYSSFLTREIITLNSLGC